MVSRNRFGCKVCVVVSCLMFVWFSINIYLRLRNGGFTRVVLANACLVAAVASGSLSYGCD